MMVVILLQIELHVASIFWNAQKLLDLIIISNNKNVIDSWWAVSATVARSNSEIAVNEVGKTVSNSTGRGAVSCCGG